MALGLERGRVRLVEYDSSWATAFENERELLCRLLGASILAIEHVGSTAVPGLCSKPIIDIAVAVDESESVEAWEPILKTEGYAYYGDRDSSGDRFFAKGCEEKRTAYLHVVLAGSAKWRNYLSFRDQLRESPSLREIYASLKTGLALSFPHNREAYGQGKDDFIAAQCGPR